VFVTLNGSDKMSMALGDPIIVNRPTAVLGEKPGLEPTAEIGTRPDTCTHSHTGAPDLRCSWPSQAGFVILPLLTSLTEAN